MCDHYNQYSCVGDSTGWIRTLRMRSGYWNDKSILIIGASSDLCSSMIPVFVDSMAKVGLHYNKNREALICYEKKTNVRLYQQDFFEDSDFERIVADFCTWAGSINYLIIMTGNCLNPVNWHELNVNGLERDYYINAVVPFMLAKNAIKHMTDSTSREISATNGMEAGCMSGGVH